MPKRERTEHSYIITPKIKQNIEGFVTIVTIGVVCVLIGMVVVTAFQSDTGVLAICP